MTDAHVVSNSAWEDAFLKSTAVLEVSILRGSASAQTTDSKHDSSSSVLVKSREHFIALWLNIIYTETKCLSICWKK